MERIKSFQEARKIVAMIMFMVTLVMSREISQGSLFLQEENGLIKLKHNWFGPCKQMFTGL